MASLGVTAKVAKIEKVTGESVLPGEVAGPGLRLTVVVHNGTDEALDLRGAVLNLYLGKDRTPGEWRSIFRQMYASGLIALDIVGPGSWSVTDEGREVLP